MSSNIFLETLRIIYKSKINLILSVLLFFIAISIYTYAILNTGTIETFFQTPILLLVGQVFFTVLNSALIAIATTLFVYLFRKEKKNSNVSFLSVFSALFVSVASTGCYICGTVLLPFLGIAASFATLPLGGLEVKILTVFLLVYSINDLSKKVLGICDYKDNKIYRISLGQKDISIQGSIFSKFKPFLITFSILTLIFALPFIVPQSLKKEVNASNICEHYVHN